MRWLPIFVCLLAAGCYERRMNAWVGHSYGELVRTWGTPTTRHRAPDGGTILTWEDSNIDQGGYRTCRRSFTTDRSGRVVRWAIDDCDWRMTQIPSPPSRP